MIKLLYIVICIISHCKMRQIYLTLFIIFGSMLARGEIVGHVTRDYFGDIFRIENCKQESCGKNGRRAAEIPGTLCRCQCAPSHYTFREDIGQCIKDVGECPVAMFVRPFAVERIPLVFLPMTGQLVYPGAYLTISGIARLAPMKHLSCRIRTSDLMTSEGWRPIRTTTEIFGVYYDGNKTFLQWLGGDEDRRRLQHHLVLIRLKCEGEHHNNGTFEPCAALRIGWAPGLEPEFEQTNPQKNNFIIIGLCLGILGLIYVGAVLIYMKVRKNRRQASRQTSSPQNTIESIEVSCEELRNTYINNLVQEAEFTTKSSKIVTNHSSVTENDMKTLDGSNRKADASDANTKSNYKSNGQTTNTENCTQSAPSAVEDSTMAQPPTQEFFVRIRGMISAAKNRLNSFRYKPTLLVIPEDDYFYQDFKEKDVDASGNRKSSTYRKFSKKKNNSFSTKIESIHGSNLGAAMLEATLAPPLPPPRNTKSKSTKSKKRAPSPPGERNFVTEYSRETPSPVNLREISSNLDCKTSCRVSQTSPENYSKFDLFRLDLYEKIHRMREVGPLENEIVLDFNEDKPEKDESFNEDYLSSLDDKICNDAKNPQILHYASVHQDSKISRRQLLCKLQEVENAELRKQTLPSEVSKMDEESIPSSENDNADEKVSSDTGSNDCETEVRESYSLSNSSRPDTSMSNSSTRTTRSQPVTIKENKSEVLNESPTENNIIMDNVSEYSETSEASLSGDSLNSSFRKPEKSQSALKIKRCFKRIESTTDLSVISGSSAITSSTAIKEIDDYDIDDDEIDDIATQDDDSHISTDLDTEIYSLDESEHPSLEEYLQLSSQVAKKMSERAVPVFNNDCPKEKNVISQFMKEFKTTIGRLKTADDGKQRASRNTSPGSDNWMLKSEEKKNKVTRRVSIFKRNPLKGRKNEEPLVTEESGFYDNKSITIETDDALSSRSSNESTISGKKCRQRYKVKTPEIVPATKIIDTDEKTVISITNDMNSRQDETMETSKTTRYTPSPVSLSGMTRNAKSVTPPLLPPKLCTTPDKIKRPKSVKIVQESPTKQHKNANLNIYNETCSDIDKAHKTKTKLNKKAGRLQSHYTQTHSIESDSMSVANSDMTEDSLNTPMPEENELENTDDISEDENGPIDRCLEQLADSVIQPTDDCSLNRYLSQLGTVLATREDFPLDQCLNKLVNNANANRATKGFNLSLHLPLCTWEHICVDKGSDRSTPTSDRSSTTSRGSHGSQENLRKKTLTKSKHNTHHHHHHHSLEYKCSNDDNQNSLEKFNCMMNGYNRTNRSDPYPLHMMIEKPSHRNMLKSKYRIGNTSEEDECGRASSLGSTRELETAISETTSDPGSADLERPRKRRPLLRKSKKGLNGTCRQQIQNSKFNKKENGSLKKVGIPARNISTPRSSGSDVTVIQLEGDTEDHITNVDSSNTFVTLINVDSSDCSNSAEEK